MNEKQIQKFVLKYMEATDSRILEKSPAHLTVKLSPAADRALTNRPYYWSFVEKMGTEPETMTFLFVTDKARYDNAAAANDAAPNSQAAAADAALGRSLGFVHGSLNTAAVRIPREDLYFGSRKLDQLFAAAKNGGSFVYLFQEPDKRALHPFDSIAYSAWLGVNIKVEFACDRKREEIHSFGVSLATGQCVERFHERLLDLRMTPRLPANVHIAKNGISLNKALAIIEQTLEKKLRLYDYGWAAGAAARLEDELAQVEHYYRPLLESSDDESRPRIQEQFDNRQAEIRWQFEPRVHASAINGGIFHLSGIG
ncbi:YqhG family protein [Paenibacillus beijingensis]|uniref:Uncharacterized protein n=1 Tax=Paenibacillus beijingensis TaxID=1126833 RepID=A0A0D5NR28_9BACL|nr:YqhG family protein [Paenibacillus beijingensis]AJY77373.1 hypothetical protein VN24_25965 [Paenibacillus beijingensis]